MRLIVLAIIALTLLPLQAVAQTTGVPKPKVSITNFGSTTSTELRGIISDATGTGSLVFGTSPTLTTPNLGTPSAATLTNATGLPIASGVSGLGTGVATFLVTPNSANLAAALTDETGTGAAVFAGAPILTGVVSITGSGSTSGLRVGSNQTAPPTLYYRAANTAGLLGAGSTTTFSVMSDDNGTNARRLDMFAASTHAGIFSNWTSGAIPFRFGAGTANQWEVTTSGHLTAFTDNTFDIGASGATRPRNIYVAGAGTFGGTVQIGNTVNSVSPTSPNRTVTMVIGGTTYYLHAKTTND